jgi:hypothetical protein
MDLAILKKKIDGFRLGNGQLQNVPPELLLELRHAWENFTGAPIEFRRELGMKIGTLRKLLTESKKLNHVLASSGAIEVGTSELGQQGDVVDASSGYLEMVLDNGSKVIRFPSVDILLEFLRKAA